MNVTTVLLVEDSADILNFNRRMLELRGYTVKTAATLTEARRRLEEGLPDLIVLDIMLPDGSGLDFCHEVRRRDAGMPVLFLTAMSDKNDIVAGLAAGGDDYLTKPYDYDIFLARIEALLRRARAAPVRGFGPLTFDHEAQRVYREGQDMQLMPREYALLRLLAENPADYFTPEAIYERLWKSDPNDDLNAVYACVSRLRRKLETDCAELDVEQKRGRGYRLAARDTL